MLENDNLDEESRRVLGGLIPLGLVALAVYLFVVQEVGIDFTTRRWGHIELHFYGFYVVLLGVALCGAAVVPFGHFLLADDERFAMLGFASGIFGLLVFLFALAGVVARQFVVL